MLILGVDIGGTFTDFVSFDGRKLHTAKILSTPNKPEEAVFRGIRLLGLSQKQVNIVHGSTVATNALLERRGAKVALVTTKGYEGVIQIGRQNRSTLYDLFIERESPFVSEKDIFGVQERVTATGEVKQLVSKHSLKKIKTILLKNRIEAVAICFLFSYTNPVNEEVVMDYLKQTGIHISASHKILPEYREFERFSTTVANAYVSPVMSRYIASLENKLGVNCLRIMQSNGGSISSKRAKERSINCVLSGPAGGVVGASRIAKLAGFEKIITFDMGGTSTDVSLCDGSALHTTKTSIGDVPIKIPVIDIHTVGAGGGSIAYLDPGGALRVGPQSAGSVPGPICYGKGEKITVTDANLFLGRIYAEYFLGGRMCLDVNKVSEAVNLFSKRVKIGPVKLAEGIIDVANTHMERAIKVISVEKGFDVRDYTLVSFGGAGGQHACELANNLSMKGVLIPKNAGVLSALGMTIADIVKDYSKSVLVSVDKSDFNKLLKMLMPLVSTGKNEILAEGIPEYKIKTEKFLDMRYVNQSHEITLPFKKSFVEDFHRLHKRLYGYAGREYEVEVVNVRVRVTGKTRKPSFVTKSKRMKRESGELLNVSRCFFKGKWMQVNIYDRLSLSTGSSMKGPALIVEDTATTFLPPNYLCDVDGYENPYYKKGD
ncbi:MAG: hydantoinase/oxoprolinase family protein [Planctomycetes bacterium]|nr:hydantoinase/oxoprolinase family protein [Planctomycetota bacterium]